MISTRNSWYLLIWLTSMCIPWCLGVGNSGDSKSILVTSDIISLGGKSKLNDALDHKFIILNGELMNLRELYDDILPTPKNFKIGQYLLSSLFKKIETISEKTVFPVKPLAGEILVQRELYSLVTDGQSKAMPATIAQNIATGSGSQSSSITALVGPSNSGKSVLLDFINYKFRELEPTVWTLNVDLSKTFSSWNKLNLNEINYHDFVNCIVRTEFQELFYNLLEINPKRIAIFIDSLDKMSRSIEHKVVSIVKTLAEKGIVTIVAGSQTTFTSFQNIGAPTKAWEIKEMNFHETKEFLKNIWASKISTQANIGHSSTMPSQNLINLRLDNYASTVASLLLHRTSLYRQPSTLIYLARTFQTIESLNSFNYALEKFPSSSSLASIQHISLIKRKLYEKFFVSLMQDRDNFIPINTYEVIALAQIIQQVELPKECQSLLKAINPRIKEAEDMIKNGNLRTIYAEILPDGKIEFIHPDFQYYFASQFFINENNPQLNSLIIKIYSNPNYGKLLEFINSEIPMVVSDQLSMILREADLKLKRAVLDNALIYGYENVFLQGVKTISGIDGFDEIEKYFNAKNILNLRVKRTFGLIESTAQLIDTTAGTRIDLLAENNMIRTFKTLQSFKGRFRLTAAEYQKLLTIVATRSKPNIEFVKLLIAKADSASVKMNFDNPLIQLIDLVGEEADPEVIKLLKSHCSAELLRNSAQDQTLLHYSIKWNNVNFLEFINNEFGTFPIDKNIFSQALDTNPSPLFTPPGWWEKMHWLIKRLAENPLVFNQDGDMNQDVFYIPIEDANKSWFKLILGTKDLFHKSKSQNNFLDIGKLQLERKNLLTSLSDEDLSQLQHSNIREWGLSAKTLALRRNLLLQQLWKMDSSITPVEMLVNYRGVNQLSTSEHYFYRHTVALALEHNQKLLNTEARNRIFNTLIDNIGNNDDLRDLEFILHQNLLQESADKIQLKLKSKLESRSSVNKELNAEETGLSVRERLLNLRVVHNPELENVETFKNEVNNVLELLNSDAGPSVPICLASRMRRRISVSSIQCHYSWEDIDEFSENPGNRAISKIQINSNKFVRSLSNNELNNPTKARQLVGFIRQIEHENTKSKIVITGTLKMLLRDIVKHGSIQSYHHYQRTITIINKLLVPALDSKEFPIQRRLISSRSLVLYAFGAIPFIRQLMTTVSVCFEKKITHSDDCFYTSIITGISPTIPIANHAITKYMPWMIDRIAQGAQAMFYPVSAAKVISQNIKVVQHLSRKWGVYTFSGGLAILGIGLDIYNVVEMSKMIDKCNQQPSQCSNKEKINYIISLTFSCISIAVTVGLATSRVGIAAEMSVSGILILLETLALALNEVIHLALYYDTHYHENLHTFVRKMTFQSPPQKIQDLVQFTNWIDKLRDSAIDFLNENQSNIVAYAVGIGIFENNNITSAHSIINMNNSSILNTHGITRVIPRKVTGITALCLSKISRQNTYEDEEPKTIKSAIYECDNAFVLANKTRWENAQVGHSSIVYNLQHINSGDITGSSMYNNVFLIFNSKTNLRVIGGGGNATNIFSLRTDGFQGKIVLHHRNTKNIIDLSSVSSSSLTFYWKASSGNGWISYSGNLKTSLTRILVSKKTIPHLHVVGRVGKSDIFICNWCNQFGCQTAKETITIDSGGGKSQYDMDQVKNCKFSVLNPFTYITGDKLYGVTYTTYVNLGGSSYKTTLHNTNTSTTAYATIEPRNSDFVVFFSNRSLLHSLTDITYDIITKDLVLTLQYTDSILLILTVKPYYAIRPMELNKNNTKYKNTVTCIFVDNYNGLTISPIIDTTKTNSTGVNSVVTRFDIFATVNSSRLVDIMDRYRLLQFNEIQYFIAVIKFINPTANQSFLCGSYASDRFYVDETTVFLFGNEGADIYMINKNIRQHIWIDNSASDSSTDTVIISDEICNSIRLEKGPIDSDLSHGSVYDVTIVCTDMKITLQNYLINIHYQHLRILWRNGIYTIIANQCQDCPDNQFLLEMALVFSFQKSWESIAVTITSNDKAVAIYNANIKTNPLAVYRSGLSDVIVAEKYIESQRPSFIVLRNFLSVNHDALHSVAPDWQTFRIFLINGSVGDEIYNPKILNHHEIFNLIDIDHHNNDQKDGDFTQEYMINFDGPDQMKNLTIFHNQNSRNDRLGILLIKGAKPTEVKGWSDGSSFIYKIKNTFITMINWCLPTTRHRLYQMEFIVSYDKKPIVIHNLHHLDCDSKTDGDKRLSKKLKNAQTELNVDDNDKSRLMHCLMSLLTDILLIRNISNADNFFFTLTTKEHIFAQDNCQILFTRDNLEAIRRIDMEKTLRLRLKRIELIGIATVQEIDYLSLVIIQFRKINDYCWNTFKYFLWNRSDATGELNFNYIRHIVNSLASCNVGHLL